MALLPAASAAKKAASPTAPGATTPTPVTTTALGWLIGPSAEAAGDVLERFHRGPSAAGLEHGDVRLGVLRLGYLGLSKTLGGPKRPDSRPHVGHHRRPHLSHSGVHFTVEK